MNVVGFDPGLTVEGAWQFSSNVRKAGSLDDLLRAADFVTVHVPLVDATQNLINADRLSFLKNGVVLLNFAREGIVDAGAVSAAIKQGNAARLRLRLPDQAHEAPRARASRCRTWARRPPRPRTTAPSWSPTRCGTFSSTATSGTP